ncbi:clathrin light chain [Phanerochaete sordida]|uniref:Clathrin light chain n=1 Tax=Phanerochaete sordida TaxID=48140 RepID=A0A9P3GAL4_9APHY|nr:clathrin light chain [Phanerochaete sordida]
MYDPVTSPTPTYLTTTMSDDFLSRESELLGDEFSAPTTTGGSFATATGEEIDFDAAASAFPDISLDGDIPSVPVSTAPPVAAPNRSFSFDDFEPPRERTTEVKVTGDDEIEKFESEFPEIEVPSAPSFTSPPPQPTFGTTPTFAPRPQPSALSSTPLLSQQIEEEEPDVIREWREKQQEEIKARDERSKAKRDETIGKAERAIDQFYEEYSAKKERNIRENKEHEEEFLQKMQDGLSAGTTWERITELVELENSQSKTIARTGPNTTDLARFREVLLRLKREGEAAPGAAGY